jgi:nucleoside-diphosphate-sugar epimerase
MRIVVLGGTRFIGRAVVAELEAAGHEVLVVHRGIHEPATGSVARHLHVARSELGTVRSELNSFGPEAAIDISGMNGRDGDLALDVLQEGIRLVAISSCDVYRAFKSVHDETETDAVPLSETTARREELFFVARDDENIELEESYLRRGAVVLRLAAVYGENDPQRRHDFVLRRIRAGRNRMPIGQGNFLFSRCYVSDVAVAVRLGVEEAPSGEIYNVAESSTWSIRLLAERIAEASGADIELVTVSDDLLPADLRITSFAQQSLLIRSHKLRSTLGWAETEPDVALRRAVDWELSSPVDEEYLEFLRDRVGAEPGDFDADDAALAGV